MRKQDKDRNGKPEALLWLDFETTGTDRNDSLDEIAPLVPQVPKEEIKAIIQQHHE